MNSKSLYAAKTEAEKLLKTATHHATASGGPVGYANIMAMFAGLMATQLVILNHLADCASHFEKQDEAVGGLLALMEREAGGVKPS